MTDKQPNTKLAAVMEAANISNSRLAERVCALDPSVRADHNDVRKWLGGMVPQAPKPQLIAHVLSEKLRRPVSLEELGFRTAEDVTDELITRGAEYPQSASAAVRITSRLLEADAADSVALTKALWVPSAASQIVTGYMFADAPSAEAFSDRVDGIAAAERIRSTAAQLMDMDFEFGGGHVRHMLVQYTQAQVVPLLRKSQPEAARREIFSAAGEVAQLLGWSAYDAGRYGAAMRYFTQGLRIAQEADDAMLGGRLLSNLSHQANFLGYFTDAKMFARAAQSATAGQATKNVQAMYVMMEARALANLGDSMGLASKVTQAEGLYNRRTPESEPNWIGYYDEEELAGDAAHCFRDIGDRAETERFAHRALSDQTPARTRAFIHMVSAASLLRAGETEQALSLARNAVELARGLQSARYVSYLSDFHRMLGKARVPSKLADPFVSAVRPLYQLSY